MPDELIGQGDVVKGYYSKAERKEQVRRFLSDGKIRATSEIAVALKMQNTSDLRKMLRQMYEDKELFAYVESRMYRWQKPRFMQLALDFEDIRNQR